MESGAKGCEVIVSGKLRAQRAKSMKFKDGYMVSSGNPVRDYIDGATRHVLLRQVRITMGRNGDHRGRRREDGDGERVREIILSLVLCINESGSWFLMLTMHVGSTHFGAVNLDPSS
jgi:hypothetical protein